MELNLQFEEISCLELTGNATTGKEETLETAIPEYCPDMARIVDAAGELFIKEQLPGKDSYTAAGSVKVTILYTSEETAGLRALHIAVPFTCQWNDARVLQAQRVCITGRVLLVEAKAITSRKVYIRVMPELTATTYDRVQRRLCTGVEEESSLRIRRESRSFDILQDVAQRELSFSQDIPLPDGAQPEDLLMLRLCPQVNSLQRLGNKLSVKGEVEAQLLYREAGGTLRSCDTTLPLGEILEAGDLPGDTALSATVTASSCDGRLLRTESGGAVGADAVFSVCIYTYARVDTDMIADLYSTQYCLEAKREELAIPTNRQPGELSREVVQKLEFGHSDPFVFVTGIEVGNLSVVQDTEPVLRCAVHMKLLYPDENGAPAATERTVEVSAAVGEVCGTFSARCCSIRSCCSAGTCELRGQLYFRVGREGTECLPGIAAAELLTEKKRTLQASLVLRRMMPGETLWDIAKQYYTDEEAIAAANPDGVENGTMLLIPSVRT